MLIHEQNFILTALSDYLHGRKSTVPVGVDEAQLLSLAKEQQIDSILCFQTRLPSFKPSLSSAAYYAVNRRSIMSKIGDAFAANQIKYLIFKGTEIASFYPNPELRQMSDLDILVHRADKEKTAEILRQMGFRTDEAKKLEDHEWVFISGNYEVELHHRLLYDGNTSEANHVAFTDKAWEHAAADDGIEYHLEPDFHFVYLMLHLRKHFLWAGVGIRQFFDLAMMMQRADLDMDKVGKYLTELDLLEFAATCFALIERWFGVTSTVASKQITEEFYESATETIMTDGVFGDFRGEGMTDNSILNATRKHGKLKTALAIIFPPYSQMKERYPKMGKYPILLPVMWFRRMIESIAHKSAGAGLNYASRHLSPSDQIKQREEMFKSWGLS